MNKQCSKCGALMKYVPGGISKKTGKPYNAFFSCTSGDKSHTENTSNQSTSNYNTQPNYNTPQQSNPQPETDWDAIARGKVRNSVATAFIPLIGALPVTDELVKVMETWVDYIMTGRSQSEDVEPEDLPF